MTDPASPDPIPPNSDPALPRAPLDGPPPERARVEGPPARRSFDALPLLYVAGFLVLGGSLFYLYRHPSVPVRVAQEAVRVDSLEQQIAALDARLASVEQRPASPPAPDLAPLDSRITALERRPVVTPPPPPAPVPATDLSPLTARIDSLAAKQAADALGLTARVEAADARLAGVEKQGAAFTTQLGSIADRAQRIARVQVATAALDAGQKLGDIPGAPPALARFATEAPPTETSLRRGFETAAEAAQQVSQPASMADQPLATRMWSRAQQSVSVRQGDRVLLGDPIAGVIGRARQALDAGDLAGAVAALDALSGPPAAAMAGWAAQVHGLLEARAALSAMAARS